MCAEGNKKKKKKIIIMHHSLTFVLAFSVFYVTIFNFLAINADRVSYDYTAYTECKAQPEEPLYQGGILRGSTSGISLSAHALSLVLHNLNPGIYSFSTWLKGDGSAAAMVTASLSTDGETFNCVGTALAKNDCWSFLKGGFVLNAPSKLSKIHFKGSAGKSINVAIASTSLQPFTEKQWDINQRYIVNTERKRAATINVTDRHGNRLQGAKITIKQISKDFPFGSALAKTILGNLPYQKWFAERFNAAVFENELKWDAVEPAPGKVDYTVPDKMLEFVRANGIIARGHNIFWEDPQHVPGWVLNLDGSGLHSAVNSRIQSLMNKYKGEFVHWDVSNEMLHFDFYEQRLGPDASLHFYETAHQADPSAILFMNEFNVVETCSDGNSTVDRYIARIRELDSRGTSALGIGLEGHFSEPNLPLMRAILDKLATLGFPIWLTEVDINKKFDKKTQAIYLEQVLKEGFSHPAVSGIMLWTALHPYGCYQMCLTDNHFQNLPAGDVVDGLLRKWKTRILKGQTDERGAYSFYGFLGQYRVTVQYSGRTATSTFSLSRGHETKYVTIQV